MLAIAFEITRDPHGNNNSFQPDRLLHHPAPCRSHYDRLWDAIAVSEGSGELRPFYSSWTSGTFERVLRIRVEHTRLPYSRLLKIVPPKYPFLLSRIMWQSLLIYKMQIMIRYQVHIHVYKCTNGILVASRYSVFFRAGVKREQIYSICNEYAFDEISKHLTRQATYLDGPDLLMLASPLQLHHSPSKMKTPTTVRGVTLSQRTHDLFH